MLNQFQFTPEVGTQVFAGEELVADLARPGARVVVAAGGTGGHGCASGPASTGGHLAGGGAWALLYLAGHPPCGQQQLAGEFLYRGAVVRGVSAGANASQVMSYEL